MRNKNAFTMIELTIVIIVMSIIATISFESVKFFLLQNHIKATQIKLNTLQNALDIYVIQNGKFPCPAGLKVSNGLSLSNCSSSSDVTRGVYIYGGVARGAVPYEELNITPDISHDAWKGKITYSVVATATSDIKKMPSNYVGITINDNTTSNKITDKAIYSIVSHGQNKKGAYNYSANSLISSSNASAAELKNIPNNSSNSNSIVYFSNNKIGDDLVKYKTRMQMISELNLEDTSCYVNDLIISNLITSNQITPSPKFSLLNNYMEYNQEIESSTSPKYILKCFKYGRVGIYKNDE